MDSTESSDNFYFYSFYCWTYNRFASQRERNQVCVVVKAKDELSSKKKVEDHVLLLKYWNTLEEYDITLQKVENKRPIKKKGFYTILE